MKGKKRRVKSIVWVIVAVLVLGVLGGFGIKAYKDYQKEEARKKEAARIKKLQEQAKLSKDQISIEVRGTYNLKLYSAEGKVTWSSEDAAVARVDEKGVVTGVSAGNTVINATYLKKKYPVKVTVTMPRVMQDDGKKVVYLTFDDGPSPKTAQVLDILKNNGVHATFFVTGIDQKSASLMKRAVDEGNAIGAHTYTHDYKYVYSSEKNYFDDLNKILNHIKEVTGKETKIIRFPGGSSNT
ncbi:polysaccharide deacetylase family protein, partial [Sharpea azabuensis]